MNADLLKVLSLGGLSRLGCQRPKRYDGEALLRRHSALAGFKLNQDWPDAMNILTCLDTQVHSGTTLETCEHAARLRSSCKVSILCPWLMAGHRGSTRCLGGPRAIRHQAHTEGEAKDWGHVCGVSDTVQKPWTPSDGGVTGAKVRTRCP